MSLKGLTADSLILGGLRESLLFRLAGGRVELISLCLVLLLFPLVPVPLTVALILGGALIFWGKGRLRPAQLWRLPLFKQIAVFWGILLLYSLTSVVPRQSLMVAALQAVFILFCFMCLQEAEENPGAVRALLACFLAAVALEAGIGLYQNFVSVPQVDPSWVDAQEFPDILVRVFGTMDNPNILAQFLVPGIVLGLAVFLRERKPLARLLSLLVMGLAAACLYYTWSRGGELALVGAVGIFLACYNWRLFLTAVLLGLLALNLKPGLISGRLQSITNLQDTSISYRFIIWEIALRIIRDFWFSGVGVGTAAFQFVYDRFYTIYGVVAYHTHDFFLQLLVEIGVFGFLIFLWLIGSFFWHGLRNARRLPGGPRRALPLAGLAAMCGYLAQGLTEQPWYSFKMVLLFWFLIAVTAASWREGQKIAC